MIDDLRIDLLIDDLVIDSSSIHRLMNRCTDVGAIFQCAGVSIDD
jgi:hypothetical protein